MLFTKFNFIVSWIPFLIYILIKDLQLKQYNDLKIKITFFGIGFLGILLIVLYYLISNNALVAFVEDYLRFNILYGQKNGKIAILEAVNWLSSDLVLQLALGLNVCFLCLKICKKNFQILTLNLMSFALNAIVIVLPGNIYGHYVIPIIPNIVVPFAVFLDYLGEKFRRNEEQILTVSIYILGFIKLFFPMFNDNIKCIINNNRIDYEKVELVEYLNENESLRNIQVMGNDCWIYNLTGTFSSSRYAYQPEPMTQSMAEEFIDDLKDNPPELVVACGESELLRNDIFLEYECKEKIGDYYIYSK